ncbi:MAG TPA: DUF302 domain-containing protein [Acidimicrobiales bacterium]|nr:DUF302 domain-containing protein [Acidimicrobiales bacterium]
MSYSKSVEIGLPYEQAIGAVKDAFKAQGFGALTEIDVRATLKEKLGEDTEPCLIIGACNPSLAHQALSIEPSVAVLLPCNVVVRARDGHCLVEAMDPAVMSSLTGNSGLEAVAGEAEGRVGKALESLAAAHPVPSA